MRLDFVNRATEKGFVSYFTQRPYLFSSLFGFKPTSKNIRGVFVCMRKDGLVSAQGLPAECARCRKDASFCLGCFVLGRKGGKQ